MVSHIRYYSGGATLPYTIRHSNEITNANTNTTVVIVLDTPNLA